MPSQASLKAANKTPKGKSAKGKIGGIPIWGWGVAIAIGLLVGFVLVKKSSGGNPLSTSGGDTSGTGSPQDSGTGGLTLDDLLKGLGLSPGVGPGQQSPSGDPSIPPSESPTSIETTTMQPIPYNPPGGFDYVLGTLPSDTSQPNQNPWGNPYTNPYSTPTSNPTLTVPGSGAQGNVNNPQQQIPGGNITGHGFVDPG